MVVILNYEDYHSESFKILSDIDYDEKVQGDSLPDLVRSLEQLLQDARQNEVLTQEVWRFIRIPGASKPYFYHIPKLHKDPKCPPGRPIISRVNSIICNLSHYLDIYLQEYVRKLPSFIKDSEDLIRELDKATWNKDLTLLTLDVTSLYTNILHELGIEAIQSYLEEDGEIPEVQSTFLIKALSFIL